MAVPVGRQEPVHCGPKPGSREDHGLPLVWGPGQALSFGAGRDRAWPGAAPGLRVWAARRGMVQGKKGLRFDGGLGLHGEGGGAAGGSRAATTLAVETARCDGTACSWWALLLLEAGA